MFGGLLQRHGLAVACRGNRVLVAALLGETSWHKSCLRSPDPYYISLYTPGLGPSGQPTNREGARPHPSADNWIKVLLSPAHQSNGTLLQYSCLENPMDGEAWWAALHGVAKSRTRLSDFTFTFHFHALEKEMATHSSVLACRIPGMG